MTPNREDYLKLLLELGGDTKLIPNKFLVHGLHISAASVTEMIGKLVKDALVTHTPYKGIQLTEKGITQATLLIRKHRLWETFLMQTLNFQWNEVHMDAEILEHSTSEKLELALEKFLGNPTKCPHGGIIPKINEPFIEEEALQLNEVRKGCLIQIVRVIDEKDLLDTMVENKLKLDETYLIKEKTKTTVVLEKKEGQVKLSMENATLIFIKIMED